MHGNRVREGARVAIKCNCEQRDDGPFVEQATVDDSQYATISMVSTERSTIHSSGFGIAWDDQIIRLR